MAGGRAEDAPPGAALSKPWIMEAMSAGTTGVFFVARTGSSRLPRKVLLEVAGKPLIVHHFDRMRLSERADKLVLCTTTSPEDDELCAIAEKEGIVVYRGSETDVPRRLLEACDFSGVEHFILCETDEHYSDPAHVDFLLKMVAEQGGDWVHLEGNPIGAWIRAVSRHAMATLCADMDTDNLSGWGLYFDKFPDKFKLANLSLYTQEEADFNNSIRLTIDYPEDFDLTVELYRRLAGPSGPVRLDAVVAELRRDPSLIEINRHRQDDYEANVKEQSKGIIE